MFSFFFLTEKIRRKSLQNDYFCNNLKNKISYHNFKIILSKEEISKKQQTETPQKTTK